VIYADIVDAGGLAEGVDAITEGQWVALAVIAKTKPPSPETCLVIRDIIHRRLEWRAKLATARPRLVRA
jgi:hypothetical protein